MKKTIVGIDISKQYFDAELEGQVKRYRNNMIGMSKFVGMLPENSHCVMESTGNYCYKLADYLFKSGIKVYVVNPLQIKYFTRMGLSKSKTDKIDAQQIGRYAEMTFENLRPYESAPRVIECSKQIQTVQRELIKQRTALYNQQEAMNQLPYLLPDVKKTLVSTIRMLDREIKKLSAKAKELIHSEYKDMVARISGINAIGEDTAIFLITATGGFSKFENSKQLASYFGCSPRIIESGSSVKARGAISKIGLAHVRTRLYMCSLTAIKYNNSCKNLYQRLLQKGKAKKLALMAVVNKLIRQIFAIAKSEDKFDNFYEKKLAF